MNKILHKKHLKTNKYLQDALETKSVKDAYHFPENKRGDESEEAYITRLRLDAEQYQFVCIPFEGKQRYAVFSAPGTIISNAGKFMLIPGEVVDGEWGKHNFLFYPSFEAVRQQQEILMRISSGCYSGMVLGDTTCDCKEEFAFSQQEIVRNGSGIVVDIPGQDGRGWSDYKMVIQRLMDDLHLNTIDAAKRFYNDTPIDIRSYTDFAILMKAFGFTNTQRLNLVNNNPLKTKALLDVGFTIGSTQTLTSKDLTKEAKANLAAKKEYWKQSAS
jgi:GTP cyclohydrolase II